MESTQQPLRSKKPTTRKPQPHKPPAKLSWFKRMFCCAPDPLVYECNSQSQSSRHRKSVIKIKKTGNIQLALLGSIHQYKLCKVTRKNLALDGYKDVGFVPNQINRYVSERVNGAVGLVKGKISPIMTRNLAHIVFLDEGPQDQEVIKVGCLTRLGFLNCDYFIYRHPSTTVPNPVTKDENESKLFKCFVMDQELSSTLKALLRGCENSVMIFPPQTVLDELGILLFSFDNKQAQIESVVVNGKIILYLVYIGNSDFVRIRKEEQLAFISKELRKDMATKSVDIQGLLTFLSSTLSVNDLLQILVKSISEADMDTVLSCFVRNLLLFAPLTNQEQLKSILKINQLPVSGHTPRISLTASFGIIHSQRGDQIDQQYLLLNRVGDKLLYQNEVDTQIEEQLTLSGMPLDTGYYKC